MWVSSCLSWTSSESVESSTYFWRGQSVDRSSRSTRKASIKWLNKPVGLSSLESLDPLSDDDSPADEPLSDDGDPLSLDPLSDDDSPADEPLSDDGNPLSPILVPLSFDPPLDPILDPLVLDPSSSDPSLDPVSLDSSPLDPSFDPSFDPLSPDPLSPDPRLDPLSLDSTVLETSSVKITRSSISVYKQKLQI